MKPMILLADAIQQDPAGGTKVSALGLGWTVTSTPTPPGAVVVFLRVPWNQTNQRHQLRLVLLDSDGNPPLLGTNPDGSPAPLQITQQFELGRPPGLPAGFDLDHTLALNLAGGMDLKPDTTYEWRLEIDGHHEAHWSATFYVRPNAEAAQQEAEG